MQVEIRLFGTLRRYLPQVKAGEGYTLTLPDGATVGDALTALGVPVDEHKQAFVGQQPVDWGYVLRDGDTVRVFSPLAGGARDDA